MQECIDVLVEAHRRVGDNFDFDLSAKTRWVAVWEMSGRCLALGNALVDQLRRGFGSEAMPTTRALHEANRLLFVFANDPSKDVTQRWLDDVSIKASTVSRREQVIERQVVAQLREQGNQAPVEVTHAGREVYKFISAGAHNRRKGIAESLAPVLRVFGYPLIQIHESSRSSSTSATSRSKRWR